MTTAIFDYPRQPHERRHGPSGYDPYGGYKPWLRDEFTFRWLTLPNALFCDSHTGSGTIGVACKRLGRRYLGTEIDPGHARTARRRIAAATPVNPLTPKDAAKPLQIASSGV